MMHVAAHGRLGGDPREVTTRSGTRMASATLAVKLQNGQEEETEWVGVVAFGKLAEALLRHKSGDTMSAAGRVQLNTWRKDGAERRQLQILADSIVSARTVRPGGGRRDHSPGREREPGSSAPPDFDDEIPAF